MSRLETKRKQKMEITVFILDQVEEIGRQSVSEALQSFRQLPSLDGTRVISVKAPEDTFPLRNVLPQSSEICQWD